MLRPVRRLFKPGLLEDMALALMITFRDPKRKDVYHPFAFQDVLRRAWWPLAERLDLHLLRQLECLDIRDRATAERFVRELETVRTALAQPDVVCISEGDAAYMLQRISEVEPSIRRAIEDWDDVVNISL